MIDYSLPPDVRLIFGVREENTYRDGEEVTNAFLLKLHEHGSELNNIPPRPVIIDAVKHLQDEIDDCMDKYVMTGDLTILENLSKDILEEIRRRIGNPSLLTHNANSTIRKKGEDSPLYDTGQLFDAITSTVVLLTGSDYNPYITEEYDYEHSDYRDLTDRWSWFRKL